VVEQQSQPVMVEVAIAAGDPLRVLDLQVEVLGRPVRHIGVVEVRAQLDPPGVQRPPEPGRLADRAVTQVGDQGCGAGAGEVGIVEPVKAW